jgi:glutamate racemase
MRLGVYDSGVGGMTVLAELRRKLRGVEFVYLGDTANVPYGTKSSEQVIRLGEACAGQFQKWGVDALVVACNTASAWALPAIRTVLRNVPVFGVVEPGVEAVLEALEALPHGRPRKDQPQGRESLAPVLVLGTAATVRSGIYGRLLREVLEPAIARAERPYPVMEQACPLLVPLIEEGWVNHPVLHATLKEYVDGYARARMPGVCLLGCTHYPWILPAVESALPGWRVIHSAQAVATALTRSTLWKEFTEKRGPLSLDAPQGRVQWLFTDPNAIPEFARRMIEAIERETTVSA